MERRAPASPGRSPPSADDVIDARRAIGRFISTHGSTIMRGEGAGAGVRHLVAVSARSRSGRVAAFGGLVGVVGTEVRRAAEHAAPTEDAAYAARPAATADPP